MDSYTDQKEGIRVLKTSRVFAKELILLLPFNETGVQQWDRNPAEGGRCFSPLDPSDPKTLKAGKFSGCPFLFTQ